MLLLSTKRDAVNFLPDHPQIVTTPQCFDAFHNGTHFSGYVVLNSCKCGMVGIRSNLDISKTKLERFEKRLEVDFPRWPHPLNFSYVWLRDHCRCADCYTTTTFQKISDVFKIPLNIRPISVKTDEKELLITWPDGHCSAFDFKFLWENTFEGQKKSLKKFSSTPWTKMSFPSFEEIMVPLDSFKEGNKGKAKLVEAILKHGVGFVTEVEPTVESTKEVVEMLCMIKNTFYGELWAFQANYEHADTAYTNEFLGAHTDVTYFTEASRIQVFHGLKAAEKGGDTLLVDGFSVAQQLKEKYPDSYEFLSSFVFPSEYIDQIHHHKSLDVMLKHHPITKELIQFRYNIYDRAPLSSLPFEKIDEYYLHLRRITEFVRRSSNEVWFKLTPGQVMFLDNWRVMHGRSQYEGPRIMGGCYLDNNDFKSRARVLGFNVD